MNELLVLLKIVGYTFLAVEMIVIAVTLCRTDVIMIIIFIVQEQRKSFRDMRAKKEWGILPAATVVKKEVTPNGHFLICKTFFVGPTVTKNRTVEITVPVSPDQFVHIDERSRIFLGTNGTYYSGNTSTIRYTLSKEPLTNRQFWNDLSYQIAMT